MNTKSVREIANIIKDEPWSVLIILSIVFLPFIFNQWGSQFPESWRPPVVFLIIVMWVIAGFRLRKEIITWRRKTILLNYLEKEKRHSISHLSKEWNWKNEFTEKNINDLLLTYPDIFKRVKVKRNGKYVSGVGLV
ncbi:MAG: hypothetical protein UU05_C0059G0003 [Candidatus Curtissbacteria bacterium GW2011_GWA1_40_47]|uniref:Uncharacterized protein n=1 Tax=Candidatus Curtissbacteria bacterium RIFOXYA1_FULL_41_14 TaxID=1797737 RepID=A0A1F5HC05_9BACT|nr:MAG: hypothetical protein UT99_C0005G0005 [Candidatus Curtissbacteria bacterium GW2011_GWA2_40_31]KKR63883.1 MAG: hypothetical protein UU05_C0059G0003 [Candidatus Curtissbacteria bacterium GW2011_GWA1_40_47]KKR75675.1 MAG: hypothetical protein UU19_C0052G0007 [Candidatus Curtissbacteria bacterium GW2011_GWD1_40_8]KKS01745.1 MAG: hypothetical protein UU53_C0008G0004 [Candidatus Curtissbacteria bacterium GW2011_GWC2_41_21]OGD92156.1 MAG: hypothetical protein A3E14_02660 [Candidatus Curtissbact